MAYDKVIDSSKLDADLTSVADAIRTKSGTTGELAFPDGFVSAVKNIQTESSPVIQPLTIAENGTYEAPDGVDGYSPVRVNVPERTPVVVPLVANENGTYPVQEGTDGYSTVTVEVQATGGGSDKFKQMVDGTITEVTAADLGNITKIAPHAFAEQDALVSVEIPESVTEIGNNAFFGCGALASITIPKNVKKFGDYVFMSCSNLASISFENVGGITTFGTTSFRGCGGLNAVHIDSLSAWCGKSFSNNEGVSPLYYGASLYVDHVLVKDMVVPEDVTTIRKYAFNGCGSLESVTMHDGVTAVNVGAFSRCKNLANVKLPNGLSKIESYTFSSCQKLTSIDIPSSVENIGMEAFAYSGLTSIVIPDSVTIWSMKGFRGCASLLSAIIGNGVPGVAAQAFDGCTKLATVEIGTKVTTIITKAFNNCTSLNKITVNVPTPPTLDSTALTGVPDDCAIYVPAESVDAYKAATNWSARADYIFAIEEEE